MNKKLLSVAIAAGLASSSASAFNADLDAGTGATSFASEVTIGTSGLILEPAALGTVTVNTGFSISDSTERYMRFDLSGATFTTAVGSGNLTVHSSGGTGANAANEVLSSGGAAKSTSVIFEVTASSGNTVGVGNDAVLTLPQLTVAAAGSVTITYKLFSDPVNAVNNTAGTELVSKTGTIASFTAANTTAVTTGSNTPSKIDVTAETKKFVANTTTTALNTIINTIGDFTTTDSAGTQVNAANTVVTSTVLQSAANLVVTGDFTFTQDLTSGAPDGTYTNTNVFLDNTAPFDCGASNVAATTLTATTATFTGISNAANRNAICVRANGVSIINEGSYTATYEPTENTGYSDVTTSLTLATLSKNGSTTSLNLALTPGGVFKNWIRVVNTSSITGDVFMTVYNDTGKGVTINLSDISGQTSNELAGQASTSLIDIADIVTAATAKDSTFAVGAAPRNKVRVVVNGEFSSIDAQSITTATDNTTFTTF